MHAIAEGIQLGRSLLPSRWLRAPLAWERQKNLFDLGGIRKRLGERLRDEQRTVDVPESEGIVGVKKNFGTDRPGRLHRYLDSGERRAASRDLYTLLHHRGIVP